MERYPFPSLTARELSPLPDLPPGAYAEHETVLMSRKEYLKKIERLKSDGFAADMKKAFLEAYDEVTKRHELSKLLTQPKANRKDLTEFNENFKIKKLAEPEEVPLAPVFRKREQPKGLQGQVTLHEINVSGKAEFAREIRAVAEVKRVDRFLRQKADSRAAQIPGPVAVNNALPGSVRIEQPKVIATWIRQSQNNYDTGAIPMPALPEVVHPELREIQKIENEQAEQLIPLPIASAVIPEYVQAELITATPVREEKIKDAVSAISEAERLEPFAAYLNELTETRPAVREFMEKPLNIETVPEALNEAENNPVSPNTHPEIAPLVIENVKPAEQIIAPASPVRQPVLQAAGNIISGQLGSNVRLPGTTNISAPYHAYNPVLQPGVHALAGARIGGGINTPSGGSYSALPLAV